MVNVSIITVVKNDHRNIGLTIESVINQSLKNIEYIIVDGYSSDGTYEIIEEYSKKYSFIKLFRKNDKNLYQSLNFGIKKAKGDFLNLIHSGDLYYSKESIKEVYNFANEKSLDLIYSKVVFFNKNFLVTRVWNNLLKKKIRFYAIPHPTLFIKKKYYKNLYYLENYKITADTYYTHILIQKAKKIEYFNKNFLYMKNSGLSTGIKNLPLKIFEDLIIYYKIYKIFFLFYYIYKILIKIKTLHIIKKESNNLYQFIRKFDYYNFYTPHIKKKFLINLNFNLNKKKLVIAALNLAYFGNLMAKCVCLHKDLYHWIDGISVNFFQKKKMKKIPGRQLIKNLIIPSYIRNIIIIGNMSTKTLIYLNKNYINRKITHIKMPYASAYELYKKLPKFEYNQLILLTISTPKQELLAEYIYRYNKFCKIICVGGALEMLSGVERLAPAFLYKLNLEFIWRLRYDTFRRVKRLLKTGTLSLLILINNYKINFKN